MVGRPSVIRVFLVDDHRLVLDGLVSSFGRSPDVEVVGTAMTLRELADHGIQAVDRPDVVLMDHHLPDGTGIDGCRLVTARWPGARIIMLTATGDDATRLAAIEAGADGYLLKASRFETVLRAVHAAFDHEQLLPASVIGDLARRLADRPTERVLTQPLTPRELTVLKALSLGGSTSGIASDLGLRQGTVRVHIEAIRRKFHVSSRLEAVSAAIQHHIVEVPGA